MHLNIKLDYKKRMKLKLKGFKQFKSTSLKIIQFYSYILLKIGDITYENKLYKRKCIFKA